ncbi:MAG TPA: MBL fold metallo-hydrolase [Saprospiraceae bacterium]|nr:MBL fold metallo-hydrolase [Saprospiraceae bacterium]
MVSENEEEYAQISVIPSLEITLLGTGTSQGIPVIGCTCKACLSSDPKDKRTRTAAFIQANNTGIAIDLGPDFRRQMLDNGLSNVHSILLTHEHNDHISGLDDIRPINYLYKRDIPIYGSARSLLEVRRRFFYAFDPEYHYPGKPKITAMVINDDPFSLGEINVIPIPVDHGDMAIYGFRIGKFAYVTDAKTIPESSKLLLKELDVLVLNALRFEPHETHLNIEEAIVLVKELKPAKCFLTHISHDTGLHAEINEILPEGIQLGYDGLKIRID